MAFTLVELLVSSAVLGIVMFILLSTLSTSLSLWRTTEGKISADREGRSANLLLVQDLANAVVPANSALWPQATANSLRFLTIRSGEYQGANSGAGDLCFVEYRVAPDTTTTNTNFVSLTRNFVGGSRTYEAVRSGNFPSVDPANAQLLAANVVPNKRAVYYQPSAVSEVTSDYFTALGSDARPLGSGQRPVFIDVNISTADDDGVRTLDIAEIQLRNAGYFPFRVAMPKP